MNEHTWTIESALEFLQESFQKLQGSPSRVLVVEDDKLDAELLTRELNKFVCVVTVCNDPVQAQQILKDQAFDYVLVDVKMPKVTGFELIEQSCGVVNPATRWVLVSGMPAGAIMTNELLKVGRVWIPKPVTGAALHSIGLRRK